MLLASAPWSLGYARPVYPSKNSVVVMKGELEKVRFLAFSADGRQITSGDGNGKVEIWKVRPAQRLRTINGSSKISAA